MSRTTVDPDVISVTSSAGDLRIEHVTKRFGTVTAVDDVDLTIASVSSSHCSGPVGAARPRPCGWWRVSSSQRPAASWWATTT